jgi:hypothetical protein
MPGSPVVGDIDSDSGLEVVAPGKDGRLYAWNANGTVVSGFPMTPVDSFNGDPIPPSIGFDIGNGITLADFDNDGKQEIFMRVNWYVAIVDGNGQQLTATTWQASDTRPSYITDNGGVTTPAVGDIDNDGKLELVTVGTAFVNSPPDYNDGKGYVYAWNLDGSTGAAFWGTMHRNQRNSRLIARLTGAPASITLLHPFGDPGNPAASILLYTDGVSTTWSVSGALPANVILTPSSGSLPGAQAVPFSIDASGYTTGTHSIGTITLQAQTVDELYGSNTFSVPITLIVGDIQRVYLPAVLRNN